MGDKMNLKEEFEKQIKTTTILASINISKDKFGNYLDPMTVMVYLAFVCGFESGVKTIG
jgi:hypothetical protein